MADIIILTFRPDKKLLQLLQSLTIQTVRPERILILNTEEDQLFHTISSEELLPYQKDIEFFHIHKKEFDHGRTRNYGASLSTSKSMVFLTQDAVLASERTLEDLLRYLEVEKVAVAYARQLPNEEASLSEQLTRTFNYSEIPEIKGIEDKERLGIKTVFSSDVCAAYKKDLFLELGGFIDHTIFNEDMIFAAKAIEAGYQIAYAADAEVIHSHHYTCSMQFRRNFDLAVSQAEHPEIFKSYSSESEGIKYIKKVASVLIKKKKLFELLYFLVQSCFKYAGYLLGKKYRHLPKKMILKITTNQNYWTE